MKVIHHDLDGISDISGGPLLVGCCGHQLIDFSQPGGAVFFPRAMSRAPAAGCGGPVDGISGWKKCRATGGLSPLFVVCPMGFQGGAGFLPSVWVDKESKYGQLATARFT